MVTGMTLIQRLTPQAQLNEGMTLAVTALLGGIAAGSAAGGWTVEHAGTGDRIRGADVRGGTGPGRGGRGTRKA